MNKSQLPVYTVLAIVLFHALFNLFFSHSRLKDAVNDIKSVKTDLRMVSDSLAASRSKISEVMKNLDNNQANINLMRREVEILYLDYQKGEAVSAAERINLKKQLNEEEKYLDSLKKALEGFE